MLKVKSKEIFVKVCIQHWGPACTQSLPCRLIFKFNMRTNLGVYCTINKQWEVIALEQLTSHMTLNAGPQQQRPESPMITPPGMR